MPRTSTLRIRISASERKLLERRARAEGLPLTTWMRVRTLKDAEEAEELERRKRAALGALGSMSGRSGEELEEHTRSVRGGAWRRPSAK